MHLKAEPYRTQWSTYGEARHRWIMINIWKNKTPLNNDQYMEEQDTDQLIISLINTPPLPYWNWSTDCVRAMCSKCNHVYITSITFDIPSKAHVRWCHVWGKIENAHQLDVPWIEVGRSPFRIGWQGGKKLSDEAKRQKADSSHLNLVRGTLLEGAYLFRRGNCKLKCKCKWRRMLRNYIQVKR